MQLPETRSPTAEPALPLTPSDEERALRETVHAIAARFGPAYFRQVNDEDRPPTELWAELGAKGFLGVHLPEELGGGGLGLYELAAVLEETASAGCPLLAIVISPGIVGSILARHGSAEQKQRWLPGMAAAELKAAFAITEPDAGSNTHELSTRARRHNDSYVLNGQKTYISGVEDADLVLVVARTGTNERTGRALLSLFVIDADAPGLTRQRIPTAVEMTERQWTLYFDDVEVPADRLIGEEGRGFGAVFDGLNPERVLAGALATGIGLYAERKACAYARERVVWDEPIGAHQAIAHPLAECKVALEHARLATRRAALLYDAGAPAGEAANMAKFAAAEAGVAMLDRAIQTHGGNGLALEYELANYWFLARLLRIAPVSREMILNYVAEHTLGLPRSF